MSLHRLKGERRRLGTGEAPTELPYVCADA